MGLGTVSAFLLPGFDHLRYTSIEFSDLALLGNWSGSFSEALKVNSAITFALKVAIYARVC